MKQTRTFLSVLLAACLLGASVAQAAVEVSLRSSSDKVVLGDELVVQVKVENADNSAQLELPEVKGLSLRQLGPPSSSSQTVIVNGQVNKYQGLTFSVGITADRIGEFAVPPFKVVHQGQSYPTSGLVLEAIRGRDLGAIDLKLSANKKQLYLGEPLILTLTWQVHEAIEEYSLKFPLLYDKDPLKLRLVPIEAGTPTEELRIDQFRVAFKTRNLGAEGTEYETSFKLFPQEAGTFLVPAAHAKAMVPRGTAYVRDFFGRLRQRSQTEAAYTSAGALQIEVKALPKKGRPPGFQGAVGQFKIEADTEHRQYQMGEPVDLKLRIWGEGDLGRIERPALTGYQKQFKFRENLAPGEISDKSLIFTQRLQPKAPGSLTLPPVRLDFFNPQTGAYESAVSEAIQLEVTPAEELGAKDLFGTQARSQTGTSTLNEGLLSQRAETGLPWWIWLFGLPLPLLATGWTSKRQVPHEAPRWSITPEALKQLGQMAPGRFEAEAARLLELWIQGQLGDQRRLDAAAWARLEAQTGPEVAQTARLLETDLEAARYGGGGEIDRSLVEQRLARLAEAPVVPQTQVA